MINIQQYLPDNFYWQPGKGLMKGEGEKAKRIADAAPVVSERILTIDYGNSCTKKTVRIQYQSCHDEMVGEPQEFTEEEILSGKFVKARPIEVSIMAESTARNVFKISIQAQAKGMDPKQKDIYAFGWTGNKFHWLADAADYSEERAYHAAVGMACLLSKENSVVTSLILAMTHGPLKRFLQAAGIQHDFVTFVVGETSVGKTALAKKICGCLKEQKTVFSLSSKRMELKKLLQDTKDVTVVVDDFNNSASDRVISAQLHTVSEIIQAASDAGGLILDDKSIGKTNNWIHLVVTSEKIIRNPSTMNRCFLVSMNESLDSDCWDEVSRMEKEADFRIFICALTRHIEQDYDAFKERCRADFAGYQRSGQEATGEGGNMHRIAETLAVQHTIKKLLADYMKSAGVDRKLCEQAERSMGRCIDECGQELAQEVRTLQADKTYTRLLPMLAGIFKSAGNGYQFADDESDYIKAKKNYKPVIGFQQNRGYVSFDPSYMCKLMEDECDQPVSKSCLGKELSHYHLAHVDSSEQKQSCRWHTEKKYYHVSFRQLLELAHNIEWGAEDELFSPEQTIQDFEEKHYRG
ncbi:hypothetical protein AALB53_16530 [Lachnospiraceae bacterium 47-T17]